MSCKGQTGNSSCIADQNGTSGHPAPAQNEFARQMVEAAHQGMPAVYDLAVLCLDAQGEGYSAQDVIDLENPADNSGWTLAHEMTRRGHVFTPADIKGIGNPIAENGKSIVDVYVDTMGKPPFFYLPATFRNNDDMAEWLNQNLGRYVTDQSVEDVRWTGVMNKDVYWFSLCYDQPQDINRIKQLMGYVARTVLVIPGEDGWDSDDIVLPETTEDGKARLFIWPCDWTKTNSDDISTRFYGDDSSNQESRLGFSHMLHEGTPVRKTNRNGPGTMGTRLVDGIPDNFTCAFG